MGMWGQVIVGYRHAPGIARVLCWTGLAGWLTSTVLMAIMSTAAHEAGTSEWPEQLIPLAGIIVSFYLMSRVSKHVPPELRRKSRRERRNLESTWDEPWDDPDPEFWGRRG